MDTDDIKQMAVKLAMLIDSFEKRGERVDQVVAQAAQAMMQASKNSEVVAERSTNLALQEFRQTAAMQLGQGLRQPVELANQAIQASMQQLHALINECEVLQRDVNRSHKRDAWKVFIASTLASLVVLSGSVYAIANAREESANAHWVSGVSDVIAAGKLAPCADDGLCVYVNNQWVRLDQGEAPHAPARKRR
jgi:prefoldin subunit 5